MSIIKDILIARGWLHAEGFMCWLDKQLMIIDIKQQVKKTEHRRGMKSAYGKIKKKMEKEFKYDNKYKRLN